jgi:hypothetical protein
MGTAVVPTRRELEQLRYEKQARQRAIATSYQQRADSVFAEWGTTAKKCQQGQDPEDYRRDLCVQAKELLPYSDDKPAPNLPTFRELRRMKLWSLDRSTFETVEPMVYRAAELAYARNDTCAPGEMRMVTKVDPVTGHKENLFYGQESFVKEPRYGNRPGRWLCGLRYGELSSAGNRLSPSQLDARARVNAKLKEDWELR